MFELLTLEEWDSIMYSVIDATDAFHGPTQNNSPGLSIIFIFYILSGSFFILNLFVGVIVSAYNEAKAKADKGLNTTKEQEKRRRDQIKMTHDTAVLKYLRLHDSQATYKGWQIPFVKLVFHPMFEWAVLLAIMGNVVFMSLEYESDSGQNQAVMDVVSVSNEVFAYIFLCEMIVKHLALGFRKYWAENWNRFDGTIVTISIAEILVSRASGNELPLDPTVVRLFRIFRVARFVRLAEKAKGIKNLIQTFLETVPYLVNVGALLSIFLFIYAVVGVNLFTNVQHQGAINESSNFDHFWSAISLLLRISTGEGWTAAMRDCQIVEGCGGGPGLDDCGDAVFSPLYFVSFMLICTYISLNVFVAVILFTFFDLEGNPVDKSLDASVIFSFLNTANPKGELGLVNVHETGLPPLPVSELDALLLRIGPPLG
jgi:hypothetical protein